VADGDIAIVGMAARLPDATDQHQFWDNLRRGHESVRQLSEEEMLAAGATREMLVRPNYVPYAATLEGLADFDAEFFGFSPKEAAILDPQHRQFLEASWEALEDAGHVPESFDGAIGVFAGCGMNGYFMFNLLTNPELVREVGLFLLRHTGNDKDFLATRASYLFNLRGPSVNVQTACSTSLVATHLAVQHLLTGECDIALAGGVTIEMPHGRGYHYEEGEVLSPDGHCRAFDHRAAGTVFGSGVGVVALRRLEDAIDDGDQIYAVIKGTAVNNDGTQKVGYLAPSVDGQAACVAEALAVADVDPETISYIECHGTGTNMGDPIEIAALTQAFRVSTDKTGYCRVGSVKTNIGHLDTAAGVASLIKVAMAMRHGEIPPSLNFEETNPRIDFENSPFYVNDRLSDWRAEGSEPRRAAVNSLGVGGTNAFAVVEEAPARPPAAPSADAWRLLVLSGRSKAAVDANAARLAAHLRANPDVDLADVAWTLQKGRRHFSERRVLAARTVAEAIELLESGNARRVFTHSSPSSEGKVAFMFPGGGTQYPAMAKDLYEAEPVFARHLDAGLSRLESVHGIDLRPWLLGVDGLVDKEAGVEALDTPGTQLPAIFIVEYALAQLLQSWGITPTALIGHSVGENTAACVAGTMTFDDCLDLVVLRGQLVDRVPGGTVAVPLTVEEVQPLITELDLDLAVVNAPDLCVVSGPTDVLDVFEERLRAQGVEPQRVKVRTAAHSRLLDVVLPEYRARLESMALSAPTIPWVSNRTGEWITPEQATDPGYWVEHFRHTVRFSDGVATLAAEPGRVLLEVGPGKTLSSLARMNPAFSSTHASIPTLRHPDEEVDDNAFLLTAVGRLWAVNLPIDVDRLYVDGPRRRVGLPTYAFQTQRYFIEPGRSRGVEETDGGFVDRDPDEDRWFWAPVWKSNDGEEPVADRFTWLVLTDGAPIAADVAQRLRDRGDDVVVVRTGDSYQRISDTEYVLAPEHGRYGYDCLVRDLVRTGQVPDRIAHLGLLAESDTRYRPGSSFFHRNQELGFHSLVFLAQAWAAEGLSRPLHLSVATMGAQHVTASDRVPWPEQATVLGPVRLISREFAGVTASAVDLDPADLVPAGRLRAGLAGLVERLDGAVNGRSAPVDERPRDELVLDALVAELLQPASNDVVALRGDRRFVQDLRRVPVPEGGESPLRRNGVVLITGGLGGIGLTVAEQLHAERGARLVLVSRTAMPDRDTWDELATRLGDAHVTTQRIRRIQALEAAGAEVLLVAADVTDVESMRAASEQVRSRFGAVNGIVHGAGVIGDELLVVKAQADMEDVLAPKVYGTLVLEEVFGGEPLDLFVLFSSTSTVTAPVGQTDYVAANAFLNAFAESRRARGDRHVQAVNWGIWNEVGMAAESAAGMFERHEHGDEEEATHPFFATKAVDRKGVARLTSVWRPEAEWFLDDHRTGDGEALLPGAGYLELARAALAEIGVTSPFEIRDLTFLRPLAVADGDHTEISTVLTPTESGYSLEVRERVVVGETSSEGGPASGRPGWRPTAEAALLLYAQAEAPSIDLADRERACPRRGPVRSKQQDHLRFGPRWQVVDRVQEGDGIAMAWLALDPAFAADLDTIGLHPALVDLGTGFAMDLIEGYTGEALWVPLDYRSIRVFGRFAGPVVAVATVNAGSTEASGFATFDVALCDPDGRVVVEVEGFTIKKLDGSLDLGLGRPPAPADVEFDPPSAADRQLSTSELTFRHNLSQGIVPDEGRRTFARAVATRDRGVLYVSSLDVAALRTQSDAAARALAAVETDSGVVFGRPQLDSEYIEPRNAVEESLVAMWQELLGVSDIGVLDNFFDLGGHSLIAVRMFAKVKKVFSVEFPISILFEAPTIESVGRLIAAAMPAGAAGSGEQGGSADAASTVAEAPPRYTHLVAMHAGESGDKTPFFLVAGMFGNVLNLRHLAHQVGTDRPFYGVQAKGIYGGEEPHDTFVEAAAAYLEEIRTVQPHGPYFLGGFSGGGITAFEMAQQLRAAGEEVGLLVFLDTATSFDVPLKPIERVQIQLDNLREKGAGYVKEWAVNRIRWQAEKRRRQQVTEGTGGEPAAAVGTGEGALHSTAVEGAFYRALGVYETHPYDGVIHLYRPKLTPLHVFGPDRQINIDRRFIYHDNGWGPFCERVEVTEVPGTHDSMVLEPNVRVLAGHLRDAILEAEASAGARAGARA
jgi:acyl transferase domain-containing protein/NAD(P)-dependent dehydrogenase (short-subunit alcohol dehydrogenase family)/acyl carrier protein